MTDTPTVIEVAPAPPAPTTPVKPTAAPTTAVAAVPGVPLAVAAANAAGSLASGALSLGGPAALTVAGVTAAALAAGGAVQRARRTRANRSLALGPHGAHRGAQRTGGLLGSIPASRRPAAAGAFPQVGKGRPAASGMRAPVRAAQHRTAVGPQHTAPTRTGSPRVTSGPAAPSRPTSTARTAARPAAARRAAPAPLDSRSSAPRSGVNSAAGSSGWLGPAGSPQGLAKGARAARPVSPGWPALSPERAAKIEARTNKRLTKGLERARKRSGLDPATGATVESGKAKSASPQSLSEVQRKALRRSANRHRARMAVSGLAAGLVGVGSAAAFNWRHRGMVSAHVRKTWRALAGRARNVKAARDAALLGGPTAKGQDGTAPVVPVPAETVNVPGREKPGPASALKRLAVQVVAGRTASRITLGKSTAKEATVSDSESTVPAFSLSSAADVMLQAASTFDPEHMTEFGLLADDLPVAFATIQEVLRVLTEKGVEQLPLDPAVAEEIGQGYQAMGRVVQALENVAPTFRQAHAEDLERVENPRNGLEAERKWNV